MIVELSYPSGHRREIDTQTIPRRHEEVSLPDGIYHVRQVKYAYEPYGTPNSLLLLQRVTVFLAPVR